MDTKKENEKMNYDELLHFEMDGAENKPEHFDHIAEKLKYIGGVVFSYTPDRISSYIISLSIIYKPITRMHWRGQLKKNCLLVGVRLKGFNFFELNECASGLHPDYLDEKIGCRHISNLLKEVALRLDKNEV